MGTPAKLPMRNGGSLRILHGRQQSQKHTEKQSAGFESGKVCIKCCFSGPQVFTFCLLCESFIHQSQKGLQSFLRTYLRLEGMQAWTRFGGT